MGARAGISRHMAPKKSPTDDGYGGDRPGNTPRSTKDLVAGWVTRINNQTIRD
jgi:hypothetical protein